MPLTNPNELDTIDLDSGEWAKVKRRMSFGDITRLEDEMAHIRLKRLPSGEHELTEADFETIDVKTGKLLLLELNVKEWNLRMPDGQPAPITRDTLGMLPPDSAALLLAAIDERNPAKKAAVRTI